MISHATFHGIRRQFNEPFCLHRLTLIHRSHTHSHRARSSPHYHRKKTWHLLIFTCKLTDPLSTHRCSWHPTWHIWLKFVAQTGRTAHCRWVRIPSRCLCSKRTTTVAWSILEASLFRTLTTTRIGERSKSSLDSTLELLEATQTSHHRVLRLYPNRILGIRWCL